MKRIYLFSIFLLSTAILFAQKRVTTTSGTVSFDATTSLDHLSKAENHTVIGALDPKTGEVQFEANVKNFAFSNPTMQGHFNGTQWMNSDKYPKIGFKGKINDLTKVNFNKDGSYPVTVTGDLAIRAITKSLTTPGTVTIKGSQISVSASFSVKLADYEITGVPVSAGKVSGSPKVTVAADLN